MKIEDFATEIQASDRFIKASFGGFSGAGKSYTAAHFIVGSYKHMGIDEPILIIDNEKGSRFLLPIFKGAGIKTYVKNTDKLGDVLKAFELANEGKFGYIFIDSLTKVYQGFVNDYMKKNRRKAMTMNDWGNVIPDWNKQFNSAFLNLNSSCVFTGRGAFEYELVEIDGKKQFVKSGTKTRLTSETPFEPDMNVWMELVQKTNKEGKTTKVWREATVLKDRSGLIDGKTFQNPTYEDFKPLVDYLIDVEVGEVKGVTDESNLATKVSDDTAAYIRQKEIAIDKIKSLFNRYEFGTSNKDKKRKTMIIEKFFGTTSMKAIEQIDPPHLENVHDDLKDFLVEYEKVSDKEREDFIQSYEKTNELPFDEEE